MVDKVAVLLGGKSSERRISQQSGKAIVNGLRDIKIDAYPIDIQNFSIFKLKEFGYNKVFIALHGRDGEDGKIQGVLEFLELPYTGSGVLASSLSMDKLRTKQIFIGIGLPVAPYVSLNKGQVATISDDMLFKLVRHLGLPLIVKPNYEGSSIGVSKVVTISNLRRSLDFAFSYDQDVIIEKCLTGPEYTVAIIGQETLPPVRIQPAGVFYDYNAKYLSKNTQYHCPSGLGIREEQQLNRLALIAYKSIGCSGWGRVDIMKNDDGLFYLLEINTVPGMTANSLVPLAARKAGITFPQLVKNILELAD